MATRARVRPVPVRLPSQLHLAQLSVEHGRRAVASRAPNDDPIVTFIATQGAQFASAGTMEQDRTSPTEILAVSLSFIWTTIGMDDPKCGAVSRAARWLGPSVASSSCDLFREAATLLVGCTRDLLRLGLSHCYASPVA